jgi:hypothetical protein
MKFRFDRDEVQRAFATHVEKPADPIAASVLLRPGWKLSAAAGIDVTAKALRVQRIQQRPEPEVIMAFVQCADNGHQRASSS